MNYLLAILIQITWIPGPGAVPVTGFKLCVDGVCTDVGNKTTVQKDIDLAAPHTITVKSYNTFGDSPPSVPVQVGFPQAPASVSVTLGQNGSSS